jgi:hypothetical protein
MFRLKSIDRHHDIQLLELFPRGRHNPEGARNNLGMHSTTLDLRQKQFKLAVAHERITSHEGDMKRPVLVDEGQHSFYQLVSLEIGELAKLGCACKMGRVERITARAPQRAFFGNFDGKGRRGTDKNVGPRVQDFGLFHDLSKSKSHATGSALADPKDSEQAILGGWQAEIDQI